MSNTTPNPSLRNDRTNIASTSKAHIQKQSESSIFRRPLQILSDNRTGQSKNIQQKSRNEEELSLKSLSITAAPIVTKETNETNLISRLPSFEPSQVHQKAVSPVLVAFPLNAQAW